MQLELNLFLDVTSGLQTVDAMADGKPAEGEIFEWLMVVQLKLEKNKSQILVMEVKYRANQLITNEAAAL
jgi:hypothetical protein